MEEKRVLTPGVVLQVIVFVVLVPFLPLLITRDWSWWEAWVYGLIGVFGFVISRALAARRHPDLLAERARMLRHEDAETWDKWLSALVGMGGGLIPLVAGLNALLAPSSVFSLPWWLAALGVILVGYALGSYALMANRFFSGVVRIQTERGHHVVTDGPYRWVRHPGCLGALLSFLATPVLLNTPWAFIPAILLTVVLVVRTALEDRTLQQRLDGYAAYARQVRYRLVPGVW